MDLFAQKEVLASFRILVDNREHATPAARRRYNAFEVPWSHATLSYGDYAYNVTLPCGMALLDENETLTPPCVVERKMSLDELALCFGRSRDRFEREFQRATNHDSRIFLLVENATWEELLAGEYRSKLHPNALYASLTAWMVRYNAQVIFCKKETSGKMIREVLYRDLKERIEKGELDT